MQDANPRSIFICGMRLSEQARPRTIDGTRSALLREANRTGHALPKAWK
jgi:hypothetical protein